MHPPRVPGEHGPPRPPATPRPGIDPHEHPTEPPVEIPTEPPDQVPIEPRSPHPGTDPVEVPSEPRQKHPSRRIDGAIGQHRRYVALRPER
jgi:hypothetical protein